VDGGDSTGCSVRCSNDFFEIKEHTKYRAQRERILGCRDALHGHKMLT